MLDEVGAGLIESVKKLSPKKGDIVVVRLREHTYGAVLEKVARVLRKELPDGVIGFVADAGVEDVTVIERAK